MLVKNQIERLIEHTKRQLDSINEHNLYKADPDAYWYRKGFIAALKLALYGDPKTIKNKPINKEKANDTGPNVDQ